MIEIRVAFADTDAMGVVHHSNYLRYFEVARIQYMRDNGLNYVDWQAKGIHLPLIESQCRYRKPAKFDDLLSISVKPRLEKVRFIFEYEVFNKNSGELLATGMTSHVPVDMNLKITKPPPEILSVFGVSQ
jgi:acyl-CoA thioester hydrolase